MIQGIYCYIDKKTKEVVYIGKDSNIDKKRRYLAHKTPYRYNSQPFNRILQNNLDRYCYNVLEQGNISQKILNALEMCFIQRYNPKFNFTKGGDGSLGFKHDLSSIKKIRDANKGKNNPNFGKTRSKEIKRKISKTQSKKNTKTGFYRVTEVNCRTCKKNKSLVYRYPKKGKRIKIYSTNIKKLEKKVISKGLEWEINNKELAEKTLKKWG